MSWHERVDAVWADEALDDMARVRAIDALAAERAPGDAQALFEQAGARDSAGLEEDAEPLYRAALRGGLEEDLRSQAVIQLASTLRNLGRLEESLALLAEERRHGGELQDAASAFYALALVSAGRAEEAASVALAALAPHLPRYTRSVTAYAAELASDALG